MKLKERFLGILVSTLSFLLTFIVVTGLSGYALPSTPSGEQDGGMFSAQLKSLLTGATALSSYYSLPGMLTVRDADRLDGIDGSGLQRKLGVNCPIGTFMTSVQSDGTIVCDGVLSTGGVCGTANGTSVATYPTGSSACSSGTQTDLDITGADGNFNWKCDTVGCSAIRLSPPSAPTGLAGTAGNGAVSLLWNASTGSPTDYIIEYKTTASATWNTFNDGVGVGTTANVTGLTNGTSYDFRVKARNAAGDSGYSGVISLTPVSASCVSGSDSQFLNYICGGACPAATTLFINTGLDKPSYAPGEPVYLIVNIGSDDNPQGVSPNIRGSLDGGTSFSADAFPLSYTPQNVRDGITGSVLLGPAPTSSGTVIVSYGSAGYANKTGSFSICIISASPPSAPTGLAGTAGNGAVSLLWNASTGSPTDYIIEYKTTASATWNTFNDGVGVGTTANVTGLTNGTSYDFRVKARNAAGDSGYSNSVTVTPVAPVSTCITEPWGSGNACAGSASLSPAPDNGMGTQITVYNSTPGYTGSALMRCYDGDPVSGNIAQETIVSPVSCSPIIATTCSTPCGVLNPGETCNAGAGAGFGSCNSSFSPSDQGTILEYCRPTAGAPVSEQCTLVCTTIADKNYWNSGWSMGSWPGPQHCPNLASGGPPPPPAPQAGVCNNSVALGCSIGGPINDNGQTSCNTTRTWNCSGINGGSNSPQCSLYNGACAPAPQAGVCNNSVALGCSIGGPINDNGQTSCNTTRRWNCTGVNGGSDSPQCSLYNGACSCSSIPSSTQSIACSAAAGTYGIPPTHTVGTAFYRTETAACMPNNGQVIWTDISGCSAPPCTSIPSSNQSIACSAVAGLYGIPPTHTVGTAFYRTETAACMPNNGQVIWTDISGCSAPCTSIPSSNQSIACSLVAGSYGIPPTHTVGTAFYRTETAACMPTFNQVIWTNISGCQPPPPSLIWVNLRFMCRPSAWGYVGNPMTGYEDYIGEPCTTSGQVIYAGAGDAAAFCPPGNSGVAELRCQ